MKRYQANKRGRLPRRLLYVAAGLLLLLVLAAGVVRHIYNLNLRPISQSQQAKVVTVASGSSVKEIARQLYNEGLIRKTWAFEWYVHSQELGNKLQAGTYAISPSSSVPQIARVLTSGKVTTRLVTILPGRRIDQVRSDLINDGFSVSAVDAALDPAQYKDLPVLSYAPGDVGSLEGLLYPDSFQKTEGTDPASIIRESLKEMGQHLTPDIQASYAANNLSVYQGITMASIVEKEVSTVPDRQQVAQVFLLRLKQDISLGSDVTAYYGAVRAGKAPSVNYDSPYNTRLHKGLPPGPISTVSDRSLQAVAHPAGTDWLFFVAGDDGVTHFEHTNEEHQADTAQYCHKLCSAN